MRTWTSASRAEIGLGPRFFRSVLDRPRQQVRREPDAGEQPSGFCGPWRSTGLPREPRGHLPLSTVADQGESGTPIGTGGGGATRYRRSLDNADGWTTRSFGESRRPNRLLNLPEQRLDERALWRGPVGAACDRFLKRYLHPTQVGKLGPHISKVTHC